MKSMADRAANRVEAGAQADERFGFATYDPDAAERRGYSDYSYWGSTLRAFLKNRVALCLLLLLVVLLAFTFIQPYLPGQYDANRINNYPATGLQVNNMNPSMHPSALHRGEGAGRLVRRDERNSDHPEADGLHRARIRRGMVPRVLQGAGGLCEEPTAQAAGRPDADALRGEVQLPDQPVL